jgi:hypothetical protein
MRANEYHDATDRRFSLGKVGIEWLEPPGNHPVIFLQSDGAAEGVESRLFEIPE